MNSAIAARLLAASLGLWLGAASNAWAGRFIATPFAQTMAKGRYSLWQFGLYEERGFRKWRSLNRLDLGLAECVELGVFVISPENKASNTWVNLQYRLFKEGAYTPTVSIGLWDMFRKGAWFKSLPSGPSPFLSLGKGYQRANQYLQGGLSYGFNRLHGLSGGMDLRFLPGTGAVVEYSPRNLRLTGAGAWDFGIYQWFGGHWRVRASWMGGNPMLDAFFTHSL